MLLESLTIPLTEQLTNPKKEEALLNFFCYLVIALLHLKGALDNFSLIPRFFSKKLRFLYH